MIQLRLVKTVPRSNGAARTVEVSEDDRPLADTPVVFIEPLLEHKRTEGRTDSRGQCTYQQPHENDGKLQAPRPFQLEVKGMAYPVD